MLILRPEQRKKLHLLAKYLTTLSCQLSNHHLPGLSAKQVKFQQVSKTSLISLKVD
jgi:hypothetical protein